MIGIDKDITNEDIQTYLKKELSDLESELKERLIFETNLLIYNDIVSQIKNNFRQTNYYYRRDCHY